MLNLSRFTDFSKPDLQGQSIFSIDILNPLRQWLNGMDICQPAQAHLICQLIPAQCPFEREIHIGNRIHVKIPPLCKLNPLYEEVVSLRFRALCYLADECSVDVCHYC